MLARTHAATGNRYKEKAVAPALMPSLLIGDHVLRVFDFLHDAAADHHAVGTASPPPARSPHRGCRSRRRSAAGCAGANAESLCASIDEIQMPGAGHALQRDVIDIAARLFGDARTRASVLVGASRKIGSMPCLARCANASCAFFRRVIHGQHAVHASFRRSAGKGFPAHRLDRIAIAHQHDRRAGISCGEIRRPCPARDAGRHDA